MIPGGQKPCRATPGRRSFRYHRAGWPPWVALFMGATLGCSGEPAGIPTDPPDPPVAPEPPEWTHHPEAVLTPSPSGFDRQWVAGSAVLKRDGAYHMWYGGSATDRLDGPISIGYATSADGIGWSRVGDGPVLAPRPDNFDFNHVQRPAVLADGDTLRLWYGGGRNPGDHAIGYATSVDGIHWVRHPSAVLQTGPAGEWNAEYVSPGTVLKEDGIFKMWFYGGIGLAEFGYWGSASRQAIGFATSVDGINWTVYDDSTTTDPPYQFSDPVLTPSEIWEGNTVVNPGVLRTPDGYEMWYVGYHANAGFIGHATSSDGIAWTKNRQNPVLTLPPWGAGSSMLLFPSVLREGDTDRLWYSAWSSSPDQSRIGLATRNVP
jgi:predicted GH43/DUF377 family glycosyl hydrolase